MLFNSIEFLVFFPIVISLFFLFPHKLRWILLLIASYYFYMCWQANFIVLIVISTIIDYLMAQLISRTKNKIKKKFFLLISLVSNLGILFFFKYLNFVSENLNIVFKTFGINEQIPYYNIILPVGISFYTFQTLSYTIDVYFGRIKPEKHFGIFALFVSFFPQLVAGPIERAGNLLSQLRKKYVFNYANVRDGLLLMLWGFFKKMVIADRIAEYVNTVYNAPHDYTGIQHLLASYLFSFQIYCDFSGYSDIAIGIALILGIRLMTNFKRPYFSISIKEFWQRWHISLSTWFKDYLYIPLGGNRVLKWRWYYNVMITFVISGIWHGANWTFIIWGAIHGLMFIVTKNWQPTASILKNIALRLIVFHIVLLSWVFFRASSLNDAIFIIQELFTGSYNLAIINVFSARIDLLLSFLFILVLMITDYIWECKGIKSFLYRQSPIVRYIALVVGLLILGFFSVLHQTDFLYFQF